MKKLLLIGCILFIGLQSAHAQAGMRLYGGLTTMSNESKVLNPDGPYTGWHLGGDFKLNDGGMSFLLGGRYTNITFTENTVIYEGPEPTLQLFNTRLGLEFNLTRLSHNIILRAKTLASIDYVFNTPLRKLGTGGADESKVASEEYANYANINSTASLIGGVGVTFGMFTFDVEYAYGLFNIISKDKETVPTFFSASAGIIF